MRELLTPPREVAPPPIARARPVPPAGQRPRTPGWDLLLICGAVYVATAWGRVHQLFPVLMPLKPALVAGVLGIALYLLQQAGPRSITRLRSPTTTCLLGL